MPLLDEIQSLLRGLNFPWPLWLGVDYRSALQATRTLAEARLQHDVATLDSAVVTDAQALPRTCDEGLVGTSSSVSVASSSI